jgi:hypothetical protein
MSLKAEIEGFEDIEAEMTKRYWDDLENPKISPEKIEDILADKLTARALGIPGWTKAKNLLQFDELVVNRMKRAVSIRDDLRGIRLEYVWKGFLQKELLQHFLTMKLLLYKADDGGFSLMENMRVVSVEQRKYNQALHDSFFALDTAHVRRCVEITVVTFNASTDGYDEVQGVELEMRLLKRGWAKGFKKSADFDLDRYVNDPDWRLVTPENVLRLGIGQVSPSDTKAIDRLLAHHRNGKRVLQDLRDLVSTAYLNGGDDEDDMLHLLPPNQRADLHVKKRARTR